LELRIATRKSQPSYNAHVSCYYRAAIVEPGVGLEISKVNAFIIEEPEVARS